MCKAIAEAEARWKERVEASSQKLLKGHWMPAHDLDHHRRVWRYACGLSDIIPDPEPFFYDQLLLACYFHDLGMIYEKGVKHGQLSRQLCESFLNENRELLQFDPVPALDAIELHDDKNYQTRVENNPVYTLLCIADDVDAFGAVGVYRYIEIYWQRGMDSWRMPKAILANAFRRFSNIREQLPSGYSGMSDIRICYERLQEFLGEHGFREPAVDLVQWIEQSLLVPKVELFTNLKDNINSDKISNTRIRSFMAAFRAEMFS